MKQFFLAVSIFLSTVACSNSKKTTAANDTIQTATIYGQQWNLIEVQGIVLPSSSANILFIAGEPNKVSGSTGCNRLSGSVKLDGTGKITFSPLAVTKMACLEKRINEIENKFLAALEKSITWHIVNGQLILGDGKNIVATLQAATSISSTQKQLNGTWELTYISGAKVSFDSIFINKKPTLTLKLPAAEANGNGGCNGYGCKVKVTGNKISFTEILSTMMACEGNGEPVYFKVLEKVTAYKINKDGTLNLLQNGKVTLKFKKPNS